DRPSDTGLCPEHGSRRSPRQVTRPFSKHRTWSLTRSGRSSRTWLANRVTWDPVEAQEDDVDNDRRQRFVELHQEGCFLLPNAWDAGSARILQAAGFPAVATTSAGVAFS